MNFLERVINAINGLTPDPPAPEPARNPYTQRPEPPDPRDYAFKPRPLMTASLPPVVDLRPELPPAYDQQTLGSCTGNAVGAIVQHLRRRFRPRARDYVPSRLFIYWHARNEIDTVGEDSGAYIRDAMKVVNKVGVPSEGYWPYLIARFTRKPNALVTALGRKNAFGQYERVPQDLTSLRAALAEGHVIAFGIMVFPGLESEHAARTGFVPLPQVNDQVLGGHAIALVGYDDTRQIFIFRNSWGPSWGDQGTGYLPYAYVTNPDLAFDFWAASTLV